uniref:Omega-theraphotoxin-Ba1c n=1 Tax=Brachypelma albiceps TaxID=503929 RepID=TXP3_BRAAI|nr:RecName: Full=Omega-theraphotoxin-Ba1c; Short=Omega-TRTX-Ba1c; AltName: Full=Venom peptide Ba3; Flags: Precursor [Brachypelma ruhnaui]AHB33348.1 toxin ba3 precursor [Brachypelma ruhnaui]
MRSLTLAAVLACSLLLVFHTSAAEEHEAQEGYLMNPGDTDTALATVDDERILECVFSCDIEKEGKPCKPKGEKKCTGGWKCKIKLCLKI